MGYCYLFNNDTVTAAEYFQAALDYYQRFRNTTADQPRIAQIQKMILNMRDTLRSRIINDIDLSDIFEHQIIVEDTIE